MFKYICVLHASSTITRSEHLVSEYVFSSDSERIVTFFLAIKSGRSVHGDGVHRCEVPSQWGENVFDHKFYISPVPYCNAYVLCPVHSTHCSDKTSTRMHDH